MSNFPDIRYIFTAVLLKDSVTMFVTLFSYRTCTCTQLKPLNAFNSSLSYSTSNLCLVNDKIPYLINLSLQQCLVVTSCGDLYIMWSSLQKQGISSQQLKCTFCLYIQESYTHAVPRNTKCLTTRSAFMDGFLPMLLSHEHEFISSEVN